MVVVCEKSHVIELPSNYDPPEGVIAAISYCVINDCGARVVWRRKEVVKGTKG